MENIAEEEGELLMGKIVKDKYGKGFTYEKDNGTSEHFEEGFFNDYSGNKESKINKDLLGDGFSISDSQKEVHFRKNIFGDYVEDKRVEYKSVDHNRNVGGEDALGSIAELLFGSTSWIRTYPKRLCLFQILVTITAILICVKLIVPFNNTNEYYHIVRNAERFPYIIVGEIVLHRILIKKFFYKWVCRLNVWIGFAQFLLYHYFLVYYLEADLKKLLLTTVGGLIIGFYVGFTFVGSGFYSYSMCFCYMVLPWISGCCQSKDFLNEPARKVMLIIAIFYAVLAVLYTIANAFKHKGYQPETLFDDKMI